MGNPIYEKKEAKNIIWFYSLEVTWAWSGMSVSTVLPRFVRIWLDEWWGSVCQISKNFYIEKLLSPSAFLSQKAKGL